MSELLTSSDVVDFQHLGFVKINLLTEDQATTIATSLKEEVLQSTFKNDYDRIIKCLTPLELFTSSKLRTQYLKDPSVIWRNSNSQTPICDPKTGIVKLYHNKLVRNNILFSNNHYKITEQLHNCMTGLQTKLYFVKGPGNISIRSKGSPASDMIWDINWKNPLDLLQNPTSYHINNFTFVEIKNDPKVDINHKGSISLLSGWHRYSHLYPTFLNMISASKNPSSDVLFEESLSYFEDWVRNIFYDPNTKPVGPLQYLYKQILLPDIYTPLSWITPEVKKGDLLLVDCRIPYKYVKNTSITPCITAMSTLYSYEYWILLGKPNIEKMFIDIKKDDNIEEQFTFGNNFDRTALL
jgi:hypothetical protein